MIRTLYVCALSCICLWTTGQAQQVILAGPGTNFATLERGIEATSRGDTLQLKPGRYKAMDVSIPHDLTITGEAGVLIYADEPVAKGLLVPLAGTIVSLKNLSFEGAASPDDNGAGVRFEGLALTVDQCTFKNNENGILATGAPEGSLTVTRSLFQDNGHGDGYSHGIYQSSGQRFSISGSVFEGTRVGHHLKTLASEVSVDNSRFDDGDGETSYVLDATAGGSVFITGNQILRRRNAGQSTIFNYDTTRGGSLGQLTIEDNEITSEKPGVRVLRNPEKAPVMRRGNELFKSGRGSFRGDKSDAPALDFAPEVSPKPAPRPLPFTTSSASEEDATPALAAQPDLSGLTPSQARAVRKMLDQMPVNAPRQTEPTPSVDEPVQAGLLRAPEFPPLKEGEVAAFAVRKVAEGSPYMTFGQVFLPGTVQPMANLQARLGGQTIPVQMDTKATHEDGSVRHGVLTLEIPASISSGTMGVLIDQPAQPTIPEKRQPVSSATSDWVLTLRGDLGDEVRHKEIRFADLTGRKLKDWLQGPLVQEVTTHRMAGPLLRVHMDTRLYKDGTGRVQLTFENHKSFSDVPRDISYTAELRDGARLIWSKNVPLHYRNSGWTAVVPIGERAAYEVIMDPALLVGSAAFPSLDTQVPVQEIAIEDVPAEAILGDYDPVTPYFPMTGGRGDIGPVTSWTAAWVVTQSPKARQAMLRAANVGLTIPWNFEEDGTGLPIRSDWRDRFWSDERGSDRAYGPGRPSEILFSGEDGGWTIDVAHKPSLAYPAYLATGDLVYLRALRNEAAYSIHGIWPDLRERGTLVVRTLQLRSAAWSLRTIGNAAFILPDDDPFKDYMKQVLDDNLKAMDDYYLRRRSMTNAGETEGYLDWDSGRDATSIAPWQNDFMTIVLANEARRGDARATRLIIWMTNYTAGRVIAADGDLKKIAGLRQVVMNQRGGRLNTWLDVFDATEASLDEDPYVGDAEGGYSILRAALGSIHAATGDARAALALDLLRQAPDAEKLYDPMNQSGRLWNPQFSLDPLTVK